MKRLAPARLWLCAFAVGFAAISALLAVTVLTTVPSGDLSRTGLVSEEAFAATAPQPELPAASLEAVAPREADVLVLGDSFSMSRQWQSVLVREGLRVATMSWDQVGGALCRDFDAWLAAAGFRGQVVVVESVERMLAERLRASAACATMKRAAALLPQARPSVQDRGAVRARLNWDAQLMSGLRTWWNTHRATTQPGDVHVAADTIVRAVPEGCKRFSHRACAKALFFDDDIKNGELGRVDAQRLQAVTQGIKTPIVWMVVPNKTTAYLAPQRSSDFVVAFSAMHLGPDLFAVARAQRLIERDFFLPNDTHLSARGELTVGAQILASLRPWLRYNGRTPGHP